MMDDRTGGRTIPPRREQVEGRRTVAVAVVLLMVLSSFGSVQYASDDSDAAPSDSWACRIAVNGTSITTTYSEGGGAFGDTEAVKGYTDENGERTSGSWGYDEDGYGPFGSFYAAFDPKDGNRMVCLLDPDDLTLSVDGEDISGKGYNIMWCLPKIYMSLEDGGRTMVLAGDDSHGGELAPAFTVGGADYDYLALGVYEATCTDGKLGSVSGASPQNFTFLNTYRTEAKANDMADGSMALLWNFHQYQLYRLCSLAVMEDFDSQTRVGYGNCDNDEYPGLSRTGIMDAEGPYHGTAGHNDDGVKLFIENAWGSADEYIDDAWFSDGFWVGQNVDPTSGTSGKTKTALIPNVFGFGTAPYSTDMTVWGFPTEVVDTYIHTEDWDEGTYEVTSGWSTTAPDAIDTLDYGGAVVVGGPSSCDQGVYSGLSFISNGRDNYEAGDGGTRLAFLFSADTEELSVGYEMNGGEPQIGPDGVQKGQGYSISDTVPEKGGCVFMGWSYGGRIYGPGDMIVVEESMILSAVWGHTVTFDLDGGAWDLEDTVAVRSGPYTVPTDIPTRGGSVFGGWMCGDDAVLPGDPIEVDSDVTLRAVWSPHFVPIPDDD